MNKTVNVSSVWAGLITALVIFAVAGLLAGCTTIGSTKETMQRSQELNQKFLNYEVLLDYNYYYSGGHDRPNAILGIHKDYQLVSPLWKTIQLNSAQLEKWIETIAPENYRGQYRYVAAYILAPNGKKVGIWYSNRNPNPVKFLEKNKIKVYSPDLSPSWEIETPIGIDD